MLLARNLSPEVLEELVRSQLPESNNAMADFLGPAQEMAFIELPIEPGPIGTIDQVLQANRNSPALQELREKATEEGETVYSLQDGLLLANGCVMMPDQDNLWTQVIRKVHDQKAMAYPGERKTIRVLRNRYYWKGITRDIKQYLRNCHIYRRAHIPRDKTPGLLYLLPIPS